MKRRVQYKVGLIVEAKKRLLLIRERKPETGRYAWNIIKGTVERSDKNFLAAARREAREEIGTTVAIREPWNTMVAWDRQGVRTIQANYFGRVDPRKIRMPKKTAQRRYNEDVVDYRLFSRPLIRTMKPSRFYGRRAFTLARQWAAGSKRPRGEVIIVTDSALRRPSEPRT